MRSSLRSCENVCAPENVGCNSLQIKKFNDYAEQVACKVLRTGSVQMKVSRGKSVGMRVAMAWGVAQLSAEWRFENE